MSLVAKTARLAPSAGKTTHFSVLVNGVDDPVDAGVVADLLVRRIDQNNFIVLHGCVLVDPVGVQDTHIRVLSSDLFFGNTLQITFKLELVDTLMLGLTEHHTTMILTLASSASDSGTDNRVSLLGLVTKTVGLVSSGRSVETQNVGALTVFPSADTAQESQSIRLLVTPDLFHIFVGTHLVFLIVIVLVLLIVF